MYLPGEINSVYGRDFAARELFSWNGILIQLSFVPCSRNLRHKSTLRQCKDTYDSCLMVTPRAGLEAMVTLALSFFITWGCKPFLTNLVHFRISTTKTSAMVSQLSSLHCNCSKKCQLCSSRKEKLIWFTLETWLVFLLCFCGGLRTLHLPIRPSHGFNSEVITAVFSWWILQHFCMTLQLSYQSICPLNSSRNQIIVCPNLKISDNTVHVVKMKKLDTVPKNWLTTLQGDLKPVRGTSLNHYTIVCTLSQNCLCCAGSVLKFSFQVSNSRWNHMSRSIYFHMHMHSYIPIPTQRKWKLKLNWK